MTLIELLVVVIILGILAAVAVPSVVGAVNSARVNSTESTLSTLQTALERYQLVHGQYPQNLGALYSVPGSLAGQSSSNGINPDNGPYVSSGFPQYDGWGSPIYYGALQNGTGYLLISGDGTSLTGPTISISGTASYVYAAGGTDGTNALGQTPEVGTLGSASNPALLTDFQTVQFSSK